MTTTSIALTAVAATAASGDSDGESSKKNRETMPTDCEKPHGKRTKKQRTSNNQSTIWLRNVYGIRLHIKNTAITADADAIPEY